MTRPFAVVGLTVFFTLALLYNVSGTATVIAFALLVLALAVSLCVKTLREGRVFPAAFASAAAACLLLIAANEFFYYPQLRFDGETHAVTAVFTSGADVQYGNYYYDAKLTSVDGEKADFKVKLVFSSEPEAQAYDSVEGNFVFYSLGSSSAAVADRYKSQGVFTGLYPADDGFAVTSPSSPVRAPGLLAVRFRDSVRYLIMRMLPNDYGALCLALVLGDRSLLSPGAYASINSAGVTHIICVSGLHLSLWTSALFFVFEKLRLRKKAAAALTMPFVALLMLVTGMTYSAVRAGIMMLIYLVSIILSRQRDALNSLGVAVTAISVFNPFSPGALSLKLSVLSTLGIILYSEYCAPRVAESFKKHKRVSFFRRAAGTVLVTVCAAAFCLPVTLDVYGTVNLAVIPSNLLVIWAGEICMILAAIGAAVSAVSLNIINLPGFAAGLLARYILKVTGFISRLGFLTFNVPRTEGLMTVLLIFMLLALGALMAYKGQKVIPALPVTAACLMAFCLLVTSLSVRGTTRVRAIDTGNGTSVLVSKNGENLLFGCGGDSFYALRNICAALDSEGGELSALILPDGGDYSASQLYPLLSQKKAGSLYLDGRTSTIGIDLDGAQVRDSLSPGESGGISFKPLPGERTPGYYITTRDIRLTVLFYPLPAGADYGEIKQSDVVICRRSFPAGTEFTDLVYAVIQADNRSGCMAAQMLEDEGIKAVATAENGNILINARRGRMNIEREQ